MDDNMNSDIGQQKIDVLTMALEFCLKALYEALEIAPLDRLPSKVGSAIQLAQWALEIKTESTK